MATMSRDNATDSKFLEEIIYPEIEPGIISKSMIEKAYLEEGHKGECARLHQMEQVVLEKITEIRLEFKNILRIDHLWVLPNLTKLSLNCNKIETIEQIDMLTQLKELDLSFNYIEKIENLEKLVNLEVLTLYHNLIEKLENLDSLENLVILSIGANKITSVDGIERFRFLKKMRILNLEGNPIKVKHNQPLSAYIAAVLPQVQYYEYISITDDVREKTKEIFAREIRDIEAREETELVQRAQNAKAARDAERLSKSFVEHLNEHQLYESLWKGDEDGRILMMVGSSAQDLAEEFDKDMFDITQEIYKLGLEKFEERELEIKEFKANLEEGQNEIQEMGQKLLDEFLKYKDQTFETATNCLKHLEMRTLRGEDEDSPESLQLAEEFEQISLDFDEAINEIWQQLMSQELHLHESIEEATINFQRQIQEMMAKFIEQAQTYFGQLREIALHFSENLSETVGHFISQKLALQDFDDVPPELRNCMEDREAILNLIAGMKDTHIQKIDEREDRMIIRSKEFIDNMVDEMNKNELQRNRAKILEINAFLDLMNENLSSLQDEIRESLLAEDQY